MTDSDPNKRPRICTCPSGACTCGIAGPGNAPLLDVPALGGAPALPPHPPAPVGGIISEQKTIMMRQYSWAQHYERHHWTCSECNGTWELFEVNNPDMAPGGSRGRLPLGRANRVDPRDVFHVQLMYAQLVGEVTLCGWAEGQRSPLGPLIPHKSIKRGTAEQDKNINNGTSTKHHLSVMSHQPST